MVAFRCHIHLAPAVSFVLQAGCSKIKPKNVEKLDIKARNVCVFTFSWSLTFSSHKKKISNFIKLKFLNDKIYSYTICKRNYLAHGNLAKLVFLLILFYVIRLFKREDMTCFYHVRKYNILTVIQLWPDTNTYVLSLL